MTDQILKALLHPGYEPGDGSMDGAQLVNGEWWHPVFGCDSLQYAVDNFRACMAQPETEVPMIPNHCSGHQVSVYRDGFHAGYKHGLTRAIGANSISEEN